MNMATGDSALGCRLLLDHLPCFSVRKALVVSRFLQVIGPFIRIELMLEWKGLSHTIVFHKWFAKAGLKNWRCTLTNLPAEVCSLNCWSPTTSSSMVAGNCPWAMAPSTTSSLARNSLGSTKLAKVIPHPFLAWVAPNVFNQP